MAFPEVWGAWPWVWCFPPHLYSFQPAVILSLSNVLGGFRENVKLPNRLSNWVWKKDLLGKDKLSILSGLRSKAFPGLRVYQGWASLLNCTGEESGTVSQLRGSGEKRRKLVWKKGEIALSFYLLHSYLMKSVYRYGLQNRTVLEYEVKILKN